jgi:hypothetical protein
VIQLIREKAVVCIQVIDEEARWLLYKQLIVTSIDSREGCGGVCEEKVVRDDRWTGCDRRLVAAAIDDWSLQR